MPRKFTQDERTMIHAQLLTAGKELFGKQGFHKTTIDQLVYAVGIAKGSFYKFFVNKESLYFNALTQFEKALQNQAVTALKTNAKQMGFLNAFTVFVNSQLEAVKQDPLIVQSFDMGFMAQFWHKLPDSDRILSRDLDINFMMTIEKIARQYHYRFKHDIPTSSSIMRSLAFLLFHSEMMGEHVEEVSQFHLHNTVHQLFTKIKRT